jgi:Fe-S-cluster containining protein
LIFWLEEIPSMLNPIKSFEKYEKLLTEIEVAVDRLRGQYPEEVHCAEHCSDCCYAVFDLSLMEAVYINYRFFKKISKEKQDAILERADQTDRLYYRLKRKVHNLMTREGRSEEEILTLLAEERIRCPFLNETDLCDLYEHRPITCRVYGLPTAIRGRACTCGKSGFKTGVAYPTIFLDRIQELLFRLSRDLLEEIESGDYPLADRLVPLSNALLTDFDDSFFKLKGRGESHEPVVGR